jgi:hypothetical protein
MPGVMPRAFTSYVGAKLEDVNGRSDAGHDATRGEDYAEK